MKMPDAHERKVPLVSVFVRNPLVIGAVLGMGAGCLVAAGIVFLALGDALPAGAKAFSAALQGPIRRPMLLALFLLCLALFALPGVLQKHLRYGVFWGAVLCFCLGGVLYNVRHFKEIDRNDAYRFARNGDQESLADMIARSPDAYVGRDSLRWFRQRMPGAIMYARRSAVSAVGMRPHRMAGLANVRIAYIDEAALPGERSVTDTWANGTEQWLRLLAPIGSEIRVAPSAAVPGARLCAWLMPDGVLLISTLMQSPCESLAR